MKALFVSLALFATTAAAQTPKADYPSCDIAAQHAVKGDANGSRQDALRVHLVMRVNILQADLGNARRARRITAAQADGLWRRVDRISGNADRLVRKQGFLSAAEAATYDRQLDDIASALCR